MQIVRTLIVFLFAAVLGAQTFRGNITGVVTDSSGAAIAGAAVSLNSPSTGLTRSAVTNSQGQYLFPDLAVGQYAITVSQAGFESRKVDGVEVAVSKTTNLNLQLGVARHGDAARRRSSGHHARSAGARPVGQARSRRRVRHRNGR